VRTDLSQIRVTTDMVEGVPVVTTEVEETEETLDDGTVVTRKVVKTKQSQIVTTSVMVEGQEGANLEQVG